MKLTSGLKREDLVCKSRDKSKDEELVAPQIASHVLIEKTSFKHLRIFCDYDAYYLYDESQGFYCRITTSGLELFTRQLLVDATNRSMVSLNYVRNVVSLLKMESDISRTGAPVFDTKEYLVLTNGTFDLKTSVLTEWSPDVFVTSGLSFPYDPAAQCPRFTEFLEEFCNHQADRNLSFKLFLTLQFDLH